MLGKISQLLKVFSHLWRQASNQADKNINLRAEEGLSRKEKGREHERIVRRLQSFEA